MDRFERQYILPGFGKEKQKKLQDAKVLVIGAGGLGCPVLLYLAAAGVGTLGIIDGDVVSVSNLNRQVLFGEGDVGINKAEAAAHFLKSKYFDLKINCIPEFLSTTNAIKILSSYDLIIDGTDNFPTRYLVNDACVLLGKPLIFGAIYQHEGQVAIFNADLQNPISYRDVFPDPPKAHEIPNCSETGVLGVLPGIIGSMQATEAIKYITGYDHPLINKMLIYNLMHHQTYTLELEKNQQGQLLIPKSIPEFENIDYALACGAADSILWNEALELLKGKPKAVLVDVRERDELPKLKNFPHLTVPLERIMENDSKLFEGDPLILFCQSGIRSLKACKMLKQKFAGKNIYSVVGGIESPSAPIY